MSKNTLLMIGILVIAGVLVVAKASNRPSSESSDQPAILASTSPEPSPSPVLPSASPDINSNSQTDDVKVVEIEAGSFYYKPNEIRVKKGQKVQVVIKSVDMMHDFNIDELKVKSPIVKSGNTGTAEFIASEVGTFEYYCSVGQHRKMGQVGTLIVE